MDFTKISKLLVLIAIMACVSLIIWYIVSHIKTENIENVDEIVDEKEMETEINDFTPSPMVTKTNGTRVQNITNNELLLPIDLLPKNDIADDFDKQFPIGTGDLSSKNFLTAGHNTGINTVSSSLRNSNLGIRSDPFIPKTDVGPWNQSTILPDLHRKPLE